MIVIIFISKILHVKSFDFSTTFWRGKVKLSSTKESYILCFWCFLNTDGLIFVSIYSNLRNINSVLYVFCLTILSPIKCEYLYYYYLKLLLFYSRKNERGSCSSFKFSKMILSTIFIDWTRPFSNNTNFLSEHDKNIFNRFV